MIIKALALAAALGTVSTVAFAQDYDKDRPAADTSATSPNTVNPSTAADDSAPSRDLAPSASATGTDVVAISPDQARAQGIPVTTITNGPVPDTRENRARFGGPMSHAGKMTAPRGN